MTHEKRFVGYYEPHELPIRSGQVVTIKKGTMIKTVGKAPKPAGKTYKITVHHLLSGMTDGAKTIPPKVVWPGPGGYWSEVDLNDLPEALEALPTLAEAERRLGHKAKEWAGRCYEIACAFLSAGLVQGVAVYGHFTGKVHPKSFFGSRNHMPFVQHGWVLLPDGRIFDPTRWGFEDKEPYLYVTNSGDKEYDEGGNQLRKAMRPPAPEYDAFDRKIEFTQRVLAGGPWKHVEKLLDIDYGFTKQEPGTLCYSQVFWLANTPFEDLQPHAQAIYKALEAVGELALVPWDNRHKADRLARGGS